MSEITRRQVLAATAAAVALPAAGHAAQTEPRGTMTPAQRNRVGERFKLARSASLGGSEVDRICRDCRLTPAELAAIESGEAEPTGMQIYLAARMYCLGVSWFFGDEGGFPTNGESCPDSSQHED